MLLATLVFQSCGSKENKVKDLVEEQIKSNLYNPKSYNEVNTTIDSLFTIDGTPDALVNVFEVVDILSENKDIVQQGKSGIIYSKHEYDVIKKQLGRIKKRIETKINCFIDDYYSTESKQFAGYSVSVSYKAKTLSDKEVPGLALFVIDKDLEYIVYSKIIDVMELAEMMMNDKKNKYQMIYDYLDDIQEAGEKFDVDDFISYMSL